MKHSFKYLFGLALAAVLFSSCDKITGGDTEESKTDIKLVGTWNVYKYEAYDTRDSLIMTMTDADSIYQSIYRYDFDVNPASAYGLIIWAYGKPLISMDYSYSDSWLRLGDYEHTKADLSDLYLSFYTEYFVPETWISSMHKTIDKVKVYCTKKVTPEQ